ncbi:MAG TPA: HAD-IB family phosphatase [Gemmatimonadaceae bacterium]|nr:HAD-IB family phosphatase [Gemmatimonadaceae bacterium]
MPAYASVVLDVDSTLCGVEGIDFLAARRGPEVMARIVGLTDKAMKGEIPLESIYGHRLTMIQPTRGDIAALAAEYERTIAPGATDAITAMRAAGVRVILVSGGIRDAIMPVARLLGFDDTDVHAVSLRFDESANYRDFDRSSPLTTQPGKPIVVEALIEDGRLGRPVLAIGDGATDAKLVGIVNTFAAYTGFARRANVVAVADLEVASFTQLEQIVTGQH